jgi:hypothetical protein
MFKITNNPFDGLSTTEALKKAQEIYGDSSIKLDELQARRIQFENTQPEAFSLASNPNDDLIGKWKGLERALAN